MLAIGYSTLGDTDMSLGFEFKKPADPHDPLDKNDPPPGGWDTGIDTRDYRRRMHGYPSRLFADCEEWEKRELKRHKKAACENDA